MRNKDQQKVASRSGSPPGDSRIRRASYYVWFLGAEECRGLRGPETVRPVLQYLLEREKDHEPEKVTLQVSGRGIKLLQQGVTSRAAAAGSTKHFIPGGALTHVQQEEAPEDDIVSAVLLIYNPLTRCPVHVHAYRCDSTETAGVLRHHLHQLLLRPEQQAKLASLETRLASRGLLPSSASSSRASDGASSGSSVSSSGAGSGSAGGRPVSGGGGGGGGEKIATLYDSLAAELREKLGGGRGEPILLPPRDYDRTGRRRKRHADGGGEGGGGSSGTRKALEDDSARSSGIGSDDAPSPTHERDFGGGGGGGGGALDHPSSSDEEWAGYADAEVRGEAGLVLVQPPWRGGVKASAPVGPQPPKDRGGRRLPSPTRHHPLSPHRNLSPIRIITTRKPSRRNKDRSISPVSPRDRFQDARDKFLSLERQRSAIEASSSSAALPQHPEALGRSTSWEVTPRAYPPQGLRAGRDKKKAFGSREDMVWPKSDRDTGYGSRDALLRERRPRESMRDVDYWKREEGRKTPDVWGEVRGPPERSQSPTAKGRARTPVREHRVPRVRSPDRQEYLRAKSMHDLSQRRSGAEEEVGGRGGRDPRRRSLYDPAEDPHHDGGRRPFTYLGPPTSPPSSTSSSPSRGGGRYHELPDNQRFPGLDRATARPHDTFDLRASKRTFDYPVNGGHAPIQITRAHHEDYRKFRYDHGNGQFMRPSPVPVSPYSPAH